MIDRSFGNFAQALRTPDIRIGAVQCELVRVERHGQHQLSFANASVLIFARKGDWELLVTGENQRHQVPCGSTVGFENGQPHSWYAKTSGELLVSWIPRAEGVLKQLPAGMIVIPPDAIPSATIMRHAIELMAIEITNCAEPKDDTVLRRCAEITMIELVRYARTVTLGIGGTPSGLAHDEYLLRAWTAYFADPRRNWTVKSLAEAAGLGRTAFAERFRRTFGSPPLQTLTRLRLEQAEAMLLHSRAPLIEIAFTVGYNSEAAFIRAFRRQFGQPPRRFKASQRKAGK